jgi:hypothetical protein
VHLYLNIVIRNKTMSELPVIGLVEKVMIKGGKKSVTIKALIDTGAQWTSIDLNLATKAGLGPIVRTRKIKAASTKKTSIRPVVKVHVELVGKTFLAEANLQDRSHMKFPMLIGRNILAGNFLVDPKKNAKLFKESERAKE